MFIQVNNSLYTSSAYNCCSMEQTCQDALPKELSDTTADYSSLDRTKINKALDISFGKDIDGRHIRSIVTDFLGYSSCSNTRFLPFIKKCKTFIKINNQNKSLNAKAVVI